MSAFISEASTKAMSAPVTALYASAARSPRLVSLLSTILTPLPLVAASLLLVVAKASFRSALYSFVRASMVSFVLISFSLYELISWEETVFPAAESVSTPMLRVPSPGAVRRAYMPSFVFTCSPETAFPELLFIKALIPLVFSIILLAV